MNLIFFQFEVDVFACYCLRNLVSNQENIKFAVKNQAQIILFSDTDSQKKIYKKKIVSGNFSKSDARHQVMNILKTYLLFIYGLAISLVGCLTVLLISCLTNLFVTCGTLLFIFCLVSSFTNLLINLITLSFVSFCAFLEKYEFVIQINQ